MSNITRPTEDKIFRQLIEATFDPNPLACVAKLGQQTFNSQAFTITLKRFRKMSAASGDKYFNFQTVACSSINEALQKALAGYEFRLKEAILKWPEPIEEFDLQQNGKGVANLKIARQYGFDAMLSCRLVFENQVIGFINHFSSTNSRANPFTEGQKKLLKDFANQSVSLIETSTYKDALATSAKILRELATDLAITDDTEKLLNLVAGKACELLKVPICIIWQKESLANLATQELHIIAAAGKIDNNYRNLKLSLDDSLPKQLFANSQAIAIENVAEAKNNLKHADEMLQRGWVSLLTAPLRVGNAYLGILDVFTYDEYVFKNWEKEIFLAFANHAAIALQKASLIKEQHQASTKLQNLTDAIVKITTAQDEKTLLQNLMQCALDLVDEKNGVVCRLDYKKGQLDIVAETGDSPRGHSLTYHAGIIGQALREGRPINAGDVTALEWRDIYLGLLANTKSELAVPLIVEAVQVRGKEGVTFGRKLIGVLNIESEKAWAFSDSDVARLLLLAQQAALAIERLDHNQKLNKFRDWEKRFRAIQDYNTLIDKVLEAITETLGFEYVNISLVKEVVKQIATEHIYGFSDQDSQAFKKMANHDLNSNNIHASIVRSRSIEVPETTDRRFDKNIQTRFGLDRLIRVFMPLIEVTKDNKDRVIGTIEAGYKRTYRPHIYERDVRLLEGFINYAQQALERKQSKLFDRLLHDVRAPIVSIKNKAGRLIRLHKDWEDSAIDRILEHIKTDCETLLHQVTELYYIVGGPLPKPKIKKIFVHRDILIKSVAQVRAQVEEELGADRNNVNYNPGHLVHTAVESDRGMLDSVISNLLSNAVKYAKDDPKKFKIEITGQETKYAVILKIQDWGIGIKDEYKEEIFGEGFRTPEAIGKDVTGSGLGLTISRLSLRELGGDLQLTQLAEPTEFVVIIPKQAPKRGAK